VHNYDKAYNIVFKVGANINKNVDIKFSVQRRLLESHSSGTLKVQRLEDQIHVISCLMLEVVVQFVDILWNC
jgi:hypothetical protein